MHRVRTCLLALPLLPLFAGCHGGPKTVTGSEPSPARNAVAEDRPVEPDFDVVVDMEGDEVSFVLYREYYECTDEEIRFIPWYRWYYRVDDCDLFCLFTVARHTRQPIDTVIRTYYYECGRDYDRLSVFYRVDPTIFFVELPASYNPGGPFDRPYRLYRSRTVAQARFTNLELRALVSLKIGVEYQGARPEQVVDRVRENPAKPHKAILRSQEMLEERGRNVRGEPIKVRYPRPWMLPEQESQRFRKEQQK